MDTADVMEQLATTQGKVDRIVKGVAALRPKVERVVAHPRAYR